MAQRVIGDLPRCSGSLASGTCSSVVRHHSAGQALGGGAKPPINAIFGALCSLCNHFRKATIVVEVFDECFFEGNEPLIEGLSLPDAEDRHVLAAAINCSAKIINLLRDLRRKQVVRILSIVVVPWF